MECPPWPVVEVYIENIARGKGHCTHGSIVVTYAREDTVDDGRFSADKVTVACLKAQ